MHFVNGAYLYGKYFNTNTYYKKGEWEVFESELFKNIFIYTYIYVY